MARRFLTGFLLAAALATPGAAQDVLRVATFDVDLSREGPGLLLHELTTKPGPKARAVARIVQRVRPDVLVLQDVDHDLDGRALAALAALIAEGPDGVSYPHRFAAPVNAGVPTRRDLDGDGLAMGMGDNRAFGRFPGDGGMAVLSRLPLDAAGARTFRDLLWRDLPGAILPQRPDGTPYFAAEALGLLPLSSRSHWDLPVILPGGGRLHLLTSHPTPPLFDGPERMNRLRNADELRFWEVYLDGAALADDAGRAAPAPDAPLVLLGDFNLDPFDGAGSGTAVARLLAHPRLRDAAPASAGAAAAAGDDGFANARHAGPPALDTVDWKDDPGPGNLRVSYILPGRGIEVRAAGVFWPDPDDPDAALLEDGPAHRLVWADLRLPPPGPGPDPAPALDPVAARR